MIDHDQLDHLLRDVVRDRAGPALPSPPRAVLHDLRARGRVLRLRRIRGAAAAAVAVLVAGLFGLVRLTGEAGGRDRVDTVDDPASTSAPSTTTVGAPAIGAPAQVYIGVAVVKNPQDGELWTADGRSLGYLAAHSRTVLAGGGSVLEARDGDRTMLWLLDAVWPEPGTVLDAVEAPAGSDLAEGCSAPGTDLDVVAAIDDVGASDTPSVVAAWTVDARLTALPPAGVTCTGGAGM